jgi:primase-polymerase (primpol)-like protein
MLSLKLSAIPEELKTRPQWALHRNKVPYQPSGELASSTNPTTWSSFEAVTVALARGDFDGLIFALDPDGPYTAIDLDHCRDADTGTLTPEAQAIVGQLHTYGDVSQSGTGVHLWTRATMPELGRKHGHREMYSGARFIVMTGNQLANAPSTIERRPAEVLEFYRQWFPAREPTTSRAPRPIDRLDDRDLLERAFAARNGDKVRRLWDGDTSAHGGDDSSADLALCSSLAFWTDDDAQIERLWLSSPLGTRDKTQRRVDYRRRTITLALADRPIRTPYRRQSSYKQDAHRVEASPDPAWEPEANRVDHTACTVEIEYLRGHVADLRQRLTQSLRREEQARDMNALILGVIRNPRAQRVRTPAIAIANAVASAVSHDKTRDSFVRVLQAGRRRLPKGHPDRNLPCESSLAYAAGVSGDTMSRALNELEDLGLLERQTIAAPAREVTDPDTGRSYWIEPKECWVKLTSSPADFLRTVATLNRSTRHGGERPHCPSCGSERLIQITVCADCGAKIHETTPRPHDAALVDVAADFSPNYDGNTFAIEPSAPPKPQVAAHRDEYTHNPSSKATSCGYGPAERRRHEQAASPLRARGYFSPEERGRPKEPCRWCRKDAWVRSGAGEWLCRFCELPPGASPPLGVLGEAAGAGDEVAF